MRYHIYKESIKSYRIFDTLEGCFLESVTNLTIYDPEFKVDFEGFKKAKKNGFKNSDDKFDYFAWIESDKIERGINPKLGFMINDFNKIWFNPFLSHNFRYRHNKEVIKKASLCFLMGNDLWAINL
jgi:hypothetical protein